jgi:primosomal protein N' (replication factor Y)
MAARGAHEEALGRFARGEVRILLGTQMIAKGPHFPRVTLVGVVSADTALDLPDFRAAERTFSLLEQVAGRAGRGDAGGEVVVQTHRPDVPPVRLAASHDYAAFAAAELEERRLHGYPPFRRLLRVVLRSRGTGALEERARDLAARLGAARLPGVEWLGPATPALPRLEGRHRRHLLVKAEGPSGIARAMAALRAPPGPPRGVEEQYDVDPVGLL